MKSGPAPRTRRGGGTRTERGRWVNVGGGRGEQGGPLWGVMGRFAGIWAGGDRAQGSRPPVKPRVGKSGLLPLKGLIVPTTLTRIFHRAYLSHPLSIPPTQPAHAFIFC